MKRKTSTSSVKWTKKNRIYLEKIGILDARTGGVKKNGMNLNKFINDSITMVLEAGMNEGTKHHATVDDLESAWLKFQVAQNNKEIYALTEEIVYMVKRRKGLIRNTAKVEITIEDKESREEAEPVLYNSTKV